MPTLNLCLGRLVVLGAIAVSAACSSAPPPSPGLLAHCTKLYMLWVRYGQHATFHHTGQRARAEFALDSCQHGRYQPGLQELEELLRRNRIPVPPQNGP
jgi:hypothetical protein